MKQLKNLAVDIRFSVDTNANVSAAEIEEVLQDIMIDYRDGRLTFDAEMIAYGASALIDRAVDMVIEQRYREKYGNAMMKTSPTRETAVAVIKADEELEDVTTIVQPARKRQNHEDK